MTWNEAQSGKTWNHGEKWQSGSFKIQASWDAPSAKLYKS